MKNPRKQFILFCIALLLEVIMLIIIFVKRDIDYSSFDDWVSSQLLLTSILTFSFSVQAWKAYQEMKKIKSQEIE